MYLYVFLSLKQLKESTLGTIQFQNKNNFCNRVDAFLNNPVYPFLSTEITPWTEPEELNEKNHNGLLFTTSNKYI